MTQLGTYDQAKTVLLPILGDNKGLHLASALTAAVVYSYASLPLVSVLDHGWFSISTVEITAARCACRRLDQQENVRSDTGGVLT